MCNPVGNPWNLIELPDSTNCAETNPYICLALSHAVTHVCLDYKNRSRPFRSSLPRPIRTSGTFKETVPSEAGLTANRKRLNGLNTGSDFFFDIWSRKKKGNCGCGWQPAAQAD